MTFRINHIVAMAENRVIGRDGGMPWHIPEDFKFFKETTMGHAMIMGRKTWESIGRALPGRLTIVITRNHDYKVPPTVVVKSTLEDAVAYCREHQSQWGAECFIVGGGELYKQSMLRVDRIYLTMIHKSIDGDTFYPEIPASFAKIKEEHHMDSPTPYSFTTWEKCE